MKVMHWFFDFPVSTGTLIIGTIVVAAVAAITFYKGLWKL